MAIAVMVNVIASLLTDLGIRQNIVQERRGADPIFLDTAWTVQIIRGFDHLGDLRSCFPPPVWLAGVWDISAATRCTPRRSLPWVLAASSFSVVIAGSSRPGVRVPSATWISAA